MDVAKVREGVIPKPILQLDDVVHAEEVLDLLTSVIGKEYFPSDVCKQILEKGGEVDMSPVLEQIETKARENERSALLSQFKATLKTDHPDWTDKQIQDKCEHYFPSRKPIDS